MNKTKYEKDVDLYYENPNCCRFCKEIIHVNKNIQLSAVKKRKYCSRECANRHIQKKRFKDFKKVVLCQRCGCEIVLKKRRKGGSRVSFLHDVFQHFLF